MNIVGWGVHQVEIAKTLTFWIILDPGPNSNPNGKIFTKAKKRPLQQKTMSIAETSAYRVEVSKLYLLQLGCL